MAGVAIIRYNPDWFVDDEVYGDGDYEVLTNDGDPENDDDWKIEGSFGSRTSAIDWCDDHGYSYTIKEQRIVKQNVGVLLRKLAAGQLAEASSVFEQIMDARTTQAMVREQKHLRESDDNYNYDSKDHRFIIYGLTQDSVPTVERYVLAYADTIEDARSAANGFTEADPERWVVIYDNEIGDYLNEDVLGGKERTPEEIAKAQTSIDNAKKDPELQKRVDQIAKGLKEAVSPTAKQVQDTFDQFLTRALNDPDSMTEIPETERDPSQSYERQWAMRETEKALGIRGIKINNEGSVFAFMNESR